MAAFGRKLWYQVPLITADNTASLSISVAELDRSITSLETVEHKLLGVSFDVKLTQGVE